MSLNVSAIGVTVVSRSRPGAAALRASRAIPPGRPARARFVVDAAGGCDDEGRGAAPGVPITARSTSRIACAVPPTGDLIGRSPWTATAGRRRPCPWASLPSPAIKMTPGTHREIVLVEPRVGDHVARCLDRHVEVRVTRARAQYAVCSRAVSAFDFAAHAVEGDGDVEGGTLVRPLNSGARGSGSIRPRALVARADWHPLETHTRALRRGNLLGQDARSTPRIVRSRCRRPRWTGGLRRAAAAWVIFLLCVPIIRGWHETFTVCRYGGRRSHRPGPWPPVLFSQRELPPSEAPSCAVVVATTGAGMGDARDARSGRGVTALPVCSPSVASSAPARRRVVSLPRSPISVISTSTCWPTCRTSSTSHALGATHEATDLADVQEAVLAGGQRHRRRRTTCLNDQPTEALADPGHLRVRDLADHRAGGWRRRRRRRRCRRCRRPRC